MSDSRWPADRLESLFHGMAESVLERLAVSYPTVQVKYQRPTRVDLGPGGYALPIKDENGNPKSRSGIIQFNAGTAFALHDASSTVASHPELWKDLDLAPGTSKDNSIAYHETDAWLVHYPHLASGAPYEPRWSTEDRRRADIGDCIFVMAVDFMVFHELGHIVLGHTDLLRWLHKEGRSDEYAYEAPGSKRYISLRRALEIEADQFAATNLAPGPWGPQHNSEANFHPHPTGAYLRCMSAALAVVSCIDGRSSSGMSPSRRVHPEASLRYLGVMSLLLNRATESGRMTIDDALAVERHIQSDYVGIADALGASDRLRAFRVKMHFAPIAGESRDALAQRLQRSWQSVEERKKVRAARAALAMLRHSHLVESVVRRPFIERQLEGFSPPKEKEAAVDASKAETWHPEFSIQSLFNAHYSLGSTGEDAGEILAVMRRLAARQGTAQAYEPLIRAHTNTLLNERASEDDHQVALSGLLSLQTELPDAPRWRPSLVTALGTLYENWPAKRPGRQDVVERMIAISGHPDVAPEEIANIASTVANSMCDLEGMPEVIFERLAFLDDLCEANPDDATIAGKRVRALGNAALTDPRDSVFRRECVERMHAIIDSGPTTPEIDESCAQMVGVALLSSAALNQAPNAIEELVRYAEMAERFRLAVWRNLDAPLAKLFRDAFAAAADRARRSGDAVNQERIQKAALKVFDVLQNPIPPALDHD